MLNEISVVWPACRAVVGEEETCCARFLEPVDSTAVVHNDVPLAQLLELVDEVIRLLVVEKRSVLSVCRNGAHRSATLLCLTLMRLFGWTAQECERHVTQLRNIVDMRSRAPPSARRVNTVRPVDWLAEVSDQVRQDRPVYDVAVNQMCTPLQLTQKALSLGFVNRCFVRKVRKLEAPMSGPKPGEGREGDVTESDVGSTVLVGRKERLSSGDGADTSEAPASDAECSWVMAGGGSPQSTPRGSTCSVDSDMAAELRQRKLNKLVANLRQLDQKVLALTTAPEGSASVKGQDGEAQPQSKRWRTRRMQRPRTPTPPRGSWRGKA